MNGVEFKDKKIDRNQLEFENQKTYEYCMNERGLAIETLNKAYLKKILLSIFDSHSNSNADNGNIEN